MKRVVLLGLSVLLAACNTETKPPVVTPTLEGYVALGDSLTAGFQSGGLTAEGGRNSYPVLLSKLAGFPINAPLGKDPGCPPPIPKSASDVTTDSCQRLNPAEVVGNFGVPGARLEDLNVKTYATLAAAKAVEAPLYNLILGPTDTQVSAAIKAKPKFITLWIGSNNWLQPLLSTPPAPVTPAATFEKDYTALLEALKPATDGAKVVLITVPGPDQAPIITSSKTISDLGAGEDDCKTSPNLFNGAYVLQAIKTKKIACSTDLNAITPAVYQQALDTVAAYNASIKKLADARGFKVFNSASLAADTLKNEYSPVGAAKGQPFGADISLDGVHPSSAGYTKIARALAKFINENYGTKIVIPVN